MSPTIYPSWFRRLLSRTLLAAVGGLAGCSHPLPPAEYRAYLADPAHGLTHTREVNGITVTCTYRPTDLLVWQDLGAASTVHVSPAVHDSVARSYASKAYCVLSFSKNNAEIENQFINNRPFYEQALNYLNTGIATDTQLASMATPDSVTALTTMYLRNYGTTGRSTVLLVFDRRALSLGQGFTLTVHDRFFGMGTLRFAFPAAVLGAIPPLRYN